MQVCSKHLRLCGQNSRNILVQKEVHVITRLHAGAAPAALQDKKNKRLLACSSAATTQPSSAGNWGHKSARGGSKDLKNTPVFLVTLCKEGIGFHSPAQTGWKNRWDTSLRGMLLQVRNKCAFFHAGKRQRGQGECRLDVLPLTSPTRRAVSSVPSADLGSDGFLCLQMSSTCEDKDFSPSLRQHRIQRWKYGCRNVRIQTLGSMCGFMKGTVLPGGSCRAKAFLQTPLHLQHVKSVT